MPAENSLMARGQLVVKSLLLVTVILVTLSGIASAADPAQVKEAKRGLVSIGTKPC